MLLLLCRAKLWGHMPPFDLPAVICLALQGKTMGKQTQTLGLSALNFGIAGL